MINPTAASATGTGSALRPFLRGKTGFLLALLLACLAFIDRARDLNAPPRFQDWRVINAQALVVGGAGRGADGRVVGEFRLWDVFTGRQLASQRFVVAAQEWRRLAHLIADQVYQRLTGE